MFRKTINSYVNKDRIDVVCKTVSLERSQIGSEIVG